MRQRCSYVNAGSTSAFAFLLFPFEIGARGWVDASLRSGDPVERAVELSVAAPVEAVALVFAGAGVERCDAGMAGELGVCVEAVDRADLAEQLRGAERSAARVTRAAVARSWLCVPAVRARVRRSNG